MAVVVATRDRCDLLAGALRELTRVLGGGDELIVVDSASQDPAVGEIAQNAGARLVVCERPGTSRARNAGFRAASAQIVAFTDDDGRPGPGWVDALARPFRDPTVGFVVGPVTPGPGPASTGWAVSVDGDAAPGENGTAASRIRAPADPMNIGHGVNMAFRREALAGVGGFDEALGPGARFSAAEDHDVLWRVLAAGWQGAYEPDALVVHEQWRSRRASLALEYHYGVGSGAVAAKLLRSAHRRPGRVPEAHHALRRRLWDHGMARACRELRRGHRQAAARSALRAAGVAVGAVRGLAAPMMVDGRFA